MPKDLTSVTVERLVELYLAMALAQFEAKEDERIARYNCLVDEYLRIEKELRSRSGDQRRELLPLLQHANVQVRFNAAISLLAVFPEEGKAALRRIHEHDWRGYYADAGSLLKSIESGRYIPDVRWLALLQADDTEHRWPSISDSFGAAFLPILDEPEPLSFSAIWCPHNRSPALRSLLDLAGRMHEPLS